MITPENTINEHPELDYSLKKARKMGVILLIFFTTLWVLSLTGLNLFLRWSIEQSMFETETGIQDVRWLVHLVCGVFLFIPLLALSFAVKVPRVKIMLRLWTVGAAFVLLSVPPKVLYLTAQVQSNLLLCGVLLLMTLVLFLLRNKQTSGSKTLPPSGLAGPVFLACAALATPWVMWGALGSVEDSLSALLLGAAFALFFINAVVVDYFDKTQPPGSLVNRKDFLFDGFVLFIFLFVVVSGLSQNGSQIVLCLSIPVCGWLLAALSTAGRNRKNHARLATGLVSGLMLALPLAFFDMDELALFISGTDGEVFYWANRAGWNTLTFQIAFALVVLIFFKQLERVHLGRRINAMLLVLSLAEVLVLYFTAGQPGFFGDRLFVVMKEQVNPAQFNEINPLLEKKLALYQALTETAVTTQEEVTTQLAKWHIDFTPYYLVNGLEVNTGVLMKSMLEKMDGIDRVLDSPRLRPLPQPPPRMEGEITIPLEDSLWNLQMINLPLVHEQLGVFGEGIIIGQTDSGVDGSHPELAGSYRGAKGSNDTNWLDPWNHTVAPNDLSGHGTGTTAIIVGATRGIAPKAQWIACTNLARNLGNPALYLDCMQFMFAPYPQGGDPLLHGKPELGAMVVNNSWGCPRIEGCDADVFKPAVEILEAAGIFMSVSAGNNGYFGCSTISDPPALYEHVFSVGSVDSAGELSAFSSKGPVTSDGSGRSKPDLLAPGEQVLVAAPGGTYTYSSGTSFAAPHVTGVVALMWSANPKLIGEVALTRQILQESAQPYTDGSTSCGTPQNESGAGILDAYAAVKAAIAVK